MALTGRDLNDTVNESGWVSGMTPWTITGRRRRTDKERRKTNQKSIKEE